MALIEIAAISRAKRPSWVIFAIYRERLLEKLKTAGSVAQQYERMPGWVKKTFGT